MFFFNSTQLHNLLKLRSIHLLRHKDERIILINFIKQNIKKAGYWNHSFIALSTFLTLMSIPKNANAFALKLINLDLNIDVNIPVNISATTNPESPVDVIYNETEEDFELTIKTNSKFDPEEDYKFDINSSDKWSHSLNFNYTNGLLEDESVFELRGTTFHNFKPRGAEHEKDRDKGDQFQIEFPSFNLETELTNPNWNNNKIVFNQPNDAPHQPTHRDNYDTNQLTITRNAGENEELSSFTYVFKGKHEPCPPGSSPSPRRNSQNAATCSICSPCSVPEPASTLSFLALGTLGAGSALLRKQKQHQQSKKITSA